MPKHLLFLFFTELLCLSCHPWKVKSYYKFVYAAEDYIIQNKFQDAAVAYELAFLKKAPFDRDVLNAMILKIERGDTSSLDYFLQLSGHLTPNSTQSFFKYLRSNTINSDTLIHTMESHVSELNHFLKDTLTSCLNEDQKVRHLEVCEGIAYNSSACIQAKQKVDSLNEVKVLLLLNNKQLLKSNYLPGDIVKAIHVIALHNSEWRSYRIHQALGPYVKKGLFDARIYALLMDKIPKPDKPIYYGTDSHIVINNQEIFNDLFSFTVSQSMNKARKNIYLRTYEAEQNVRFWQLTRSTPFRFVSAYKINVPKEHFGTMKNKIKSTCPMGSFTDLNFKNKTEVESSSR